MRQRFAQDRHVGQVKRHVVERFRRRLPFEERDRDVVVANRNSIFEFEFLAQTECALKPERAFLWVAHGQTKMSDHAELERDFHFHISNKRAACEKRTHPKMIALALILCAAIAGTGVLVIVKPALAHDLTRLFADKTGMWIATAIRAVLALGLLAAAAESKAPMLLRILGLIILIVAIVMPILGLDRHRRMIEWWLARKRPVEIMCGAAALVFGIGLIYIIL